MVDELDRTVMSTGSRLLWQGIVSFAECRMTWLPAGCRLMTELHRPTGLVIAGSVLEYRHDRMNCLVLAIRHGHVHRMCTAYWNVPGNPESCQCER